MFYNFVSEDIVKNKEKGGDVRFIQYTSNENRITVLDNTLLSIVLKNFNFRNRFIIKLIITKTIHLTAKCYNYVLIK